MLLDLKLIGASAASGGETLDFTHELDLSAVRLWGERPFLKPVLITGQAICRFEAYVIEYTAEFEMTGLCSRCLAQISRAYKRKFEHTVLTDCGDESVGDSIPAPGAKLDLDELVTSDLLLDFDGVMLCGEECRGLCPKCGKNLNEGDCGCVLKEPDPRFDILRKLIE